MKLRNKKTGETTEGDVWIKTKFHRKPWHCASMAELEEHWEDYVPKEPLIDFYDDRKLVRYWAEARNIKEVWAHGIGDGKEVVEIYDVENGLMRLTFYRPKKMEIDKAYTVAELCGEEDDEA